MFLYDCLIVRLFTFNARSKVGYKVVKITKFKLNILACQAKNTATWNVNTNCIEGQVHIW